MEYEPKHHFEIQVTDQSKDFNSENLSKFQAVLFLNCNGDILNEVQQESLKKYIRNGGGFVGIHGATNAEKEWDWYGQLVGRYFTAHPKKQSAIIHIKESDFPATYHLPDKWLWTDEWYEFTEAYSDSLKVLLTVDEETYNHTFESKGKRFTGMQPEHPIAWYQYFEGGRMFYTSLGHLEKAWEDPLFLQHVYGGIWWALTSK